MLFQAVYPLSLNAADLSSDAQRILKASLADSSWSQYNSYFGRFRRFCLDNSVDFSTISCSTGIEFLTVLFNSGLGYSSINTARSAISQFAVLDGSPLSFGNHPLTTRFMRGVYKLRPPLPKYDCIWDVTSVTDFLRGWAVSDLKSISRKCAMLLALISGQRVQTLSKLSLDFMIMSETEITFCIENTLKTSRPGRSQNLVVRAYPFDEKVCPLKCLKEYLAITAPVRKSNSLFVSFTKPHNAITSQTLRRWLCDVLHAAGIDTKFGAHSIRHASSSKAFRQHVPVDRILFSAGWSSERTFQRFYNIPTPDDKSTPLSAILNV